MYDDMEFADEYCGFDESDRDAYENEQVERDEFDDPRDEDWAMDMEDEADDSDWPQAEADGFFWHEFE